MPCFGETSGCGNCTDQATTVEAGPRERPSRPDLDIMPGSAEAETPSPKENADAPTPAPFEVVEEPGRTIKRNDLVAADRSIDTIAHEPKDARKASPTLLESDNDARMVCRIASDKSEDTQAYNAISEETTRMNDTSLKASNEDVQTALFCAPHLGLGDGSVNSEDVFMTDDSSLSEAADSDFADSLLTMNPAADAATPANTPTPQLKARRRKLKQVRKEYSRARPKFPKGQEIQPANRERLRRKASKGVSFTHLFEQDISLTEEDPPGQGVPPKISQLRDVFNQGPDGLLSVFARTTPSAVQPALPSRIESEPPKSSQFPHTGHIRQQLPPTAQKTPQPSPKAAQGKTSSKDSTRGCKPAAKRDPFGCGCMPNALHMLEDLETRNDRMEECSGGSVSEFLAQCLLKCTEMLDCRPCGQRSDYIMFLVIICQKISKAFSRLATTCAGGLSSITPDGTRTVPLTSVVLYQVPRLETVLARLKTIAKQRNWKTHIAMLDPISQYFEDTRARLKRINELRIQSDPVTSGAKISQDIIT